MSRGSLGAVRLDPTAIVRCICCGENIEQGWLSSCCSRCPKCCPTKDCRESRPSP